MLEPVACRLDPLLPYVGCCPVQGVQRRVEPGVSNDVEPGLNAEQRAGGKVGCSFVNRQVEAAALPRSIAVVVP
ncbi:hypothetical protein D9M72_633680 [compost metagenome]